MYKIRGRGGGGGGGVSGLAGMRAPAGTMLCSRDLHGHVPHYQVNDSHHCSTIVGAMTVVLKVH